MPEITFIVWLDREPALVLKAEGEVHEVQCKIQAPTPAWDMPQVWGNIVLTMHEGSVRKDLGTSLRRTD